MSKAALKDILQELTGETDRAGKVKREGSKHFREQIANKLVTELTISKSSLLKEISSQLKNIAGFSQGNKLLPEVDRELPRIIDKAYEQMLVLADTSARGAKFEVTRNIISPDTFVVIAEGKEGDRFARIRNNIVAPGLKVVREELDKLIANTNILTEKKFIDLGHTELNPSNEVFIGRMLSGREGVRFNKTGAVEKVGSNIASGFGHDPLPQRESVRPHLETVLETIVRTQKLSTEKRDRVLEIASQFNTKGDKEFYIKLEFEAASDNQGKAEDRELVSNFRKALLAYVDKTDWANAPGSDSKVRQVSKKLIRNAIAKGAKFSGDRNLLLASDTKANKVSQKTTIVKQKTKLNTEVKGKSKQRGSNIRAQKSYASLIALINGRLSSYIKANMKAPRLINRTGRFAESAKVTQITETPQGFPSIEYTYQRDPYDVFDRRLGTQPWNTGARDPRDLIELSMRQLLSGIAIGRFYMRRA